MRRTALLLLASMVLAGCTDDRVDLTYRLVEGTTFQYDLLLRAEVEGTLEGDTRSQDVVATFGVTQEVLEHIEDGGSTARLVLTPRTLVVDGRPAEAGAVQEFLVELGPDGRVIGIGEPTRETAQELALVGIERLLPRLRPVLPATEVAAGATWSSETDFEAPGGTFSLATESRLAELTMLGGRPAALVQTTYRSPVDRQETYANAVAHVRGTDVGAQQAWFALDGFLIRARGNSVGTYDVTFRPPEGEQAVEPVEATLVVDLHTEMELVEPPAAGGG